MKKSSKVLIKHQNSIKRKGNLIIFILFSVLLICSAVNTSANGTAALISIDVKDTPVSTVLYDIEHQSDYRFLYSEKYVDLYRKVSLKVHDSTVEPVLNLLFDGTKVSYEISDRIIVLYVPEVSATSKNIVQQPLSVSGVVKDNTGIGLPGVSVVVQGTTTGVLTGLDGHFQIQVPSAGSVLQFSFIGYTSQSVTVGNQTQINIIMEEDIMQLDEVVVVGYGTQAKKDITGSVSVVNAETLSETAVVTFAEALQGKSAGVYVQSSGAPGSSTTIRVRGVGSVNGSDPLVIIDGISGGDINSVNANDIESFQVLKDASATAIYGAQGANGVIIVTTKQGTKTGLAKVSYNGYVGISKMSNSGYDVLGGWDLMEFAAQGMRNLKNIRGVTPSADAQFGALKDYDVDSEGDWIGGTLTMPYSVKPTGYSEQDIIDQFGSVDAWEASYLSDGSNSWVRSAYYQILEDGGSEEEARRGTDWYSLILRTGKIQDHQLSVVGGNDKGQYSTSFSYTDQDGTVMNSYFKRYSFRVNTSYNPRTFFTIGQNSNITLTEYQGERSGNNESSVFGRTFTMKSWVPAYTIGGDYAASQVQDGGRNASPLEMAAHQKGDWTRDLRLQNTGFLEIKPVPFLTFRTQIASNINVGWSNRFSEITIMGNKEGSSTNSFTESADWRFGWQWTNTLTYSQKINNHNITAVVGSEALDQDYGRNISASRVDYDFEDEPNTWTLSNGSSSNITNSGSISEHTSMFGYFFRGDYSYSGKYLATLTVRRDASSKFGLNNRWGTFPSISLGWRISDESFMDATDNWLDDFKLRAGYGTTGNSNIGSYNYAFQYATGNNYAYASTGSNTIISKGYSISNLGDKNAKWETTSMFNVGFDGSVFDDRLSFEFDYYIKRTTDMLVDANWSDQAGAASRPQINIGDMENKGVDFRIGWDDKIGKFSYGVSANITSYKNKVLKLGSSDIFNNTRIARVNITTTGEPIGMFYGYNVIGLYKSAEEVISYKTESGTTVLPYGLTDITDLETYEKDSEGNYLDTKVYDNIEDDPKILTWVGRFKFEDVDGDGKINANDQTIIGNPHPDFSGGFNLSTGYGNWDLNAYLYFSVGNDLYRHYIYYTFYGSQQSNYAKERRDNSWHPVDNPDGYLPLWTGSANEATETTTTSNSLYISDGTYVRMQTLSIGYNLPTSVLNKIGISQLRIYGQASNLFTITNYEGLDPEVRTTNDLNRGIDYGAYGMPRQFILGVNATF